MNFTDQESECTKNDALPTIKNSCSFRSARFLTPNPPNLPPKMSSSDCSHHHRQSLWSLNLFFRPSLSPLSACSPSLTNILTGILSNTSAFSLKSFYVFLSFFFFFFTSFSSRLQSTAFFVLLSIHPFLFSTVFRRNVFICASVTVIWTKCKCFDEHESFL